MKILNLYSGIGGNRRLWGNEYDITAKHVLKKGECRGSLSVFKKMITGFKVEDIVIPVVGLFDKTLPSLAQKKICFAWLDADLYSSTLVGYRFLEDRIMPGGILGFHDYKFVRCPGVTKVITEVLDHDKFKQIDCQNGCIFFKRENTKEARDV